MKKHSKIIVFLLLFVFVPLFAGKAVALDNKSIECLSCHDAALATDSTIITVCSAPDCDHPLGVDYNFASMTNFGLKSPTLLDPNIKLAYNTDIACTSCHVPYKQSDHVTLSTLRGLYPNDPDPMLTVDNTASGLCFGCHYK